MKKWIRKHWIFLTLCGLVLFNSIFLFTKGMAWQHDIDFHVNRMISLAQTLKNGDFLALIHDTFYGHGYALGIFYGNFFFYLPSFLCLIGIPPIIAYKVLFLLMNISTVAITFYVSKRIIKCSKVSLFVTILYTLSAYRLYDFFVRGAIGEILAFMIVPLILLGLYEIIYEDYHKWYLFTIGFVLLLLSHVITTVLMAVFSIIILIFNSKRLVQEPSRIRSLLTSGVVGLLLGGFFLFPILEQYFCSSIQIFQGGSYYLPSKSVLGISDIFLPKQLFQCYLGIGMVILLPLRFFYSKKKIGPKYRTLASFGDLLWILGMISLLATTRLFPWQALESSLSFIQFPWRFLLFATLFFAVSFGISLWILLENKKKTVPQILGVLAILISVSICLLYSVQYGIRKNRYSSFVPNEIGKGEYLLAGTSLKQMEVANRAIISNNPGLVFTYQKKGTTITVQYENNLLENTYIELPLIYYLGYDSNKDLEFGYSEDNLIRVYLEEKEGEFTVSYQGTWIQKVSYVVSLVTFIGFGIYFFKFRKKIHPMP